jgi:uncharacterized protein involved in exopolysaccharide biosynthesis
VSWLANRIQEERIKVEEAQMRFQKYKEENSIITNFSRTPNRSHSKTGRTEQQGHRAEAPASKAETRSTRPGG